MNGLQLNRLFGWNFLFLTAIFTNELRLSASVTYVLKREEKCSGEKVLGKCRAFGQMVARINDNTAFMTVQEAFNDTDRKKYWTGLRWSKHYSKFYWEGYESQNITVDSRIVNTTGLKNSTYCFLVSKNGTQLEAKTCSNKHYFICESGYETIGCYKDTLNRAIQSLKAKDSVLGGSSGSHKNRLAMCAVAAMRANFSIFAVQYGGECYASSTAPQTFDKYGKSTACLADGKGGNWANQVYVIRGYATIGCYKDAADRAIQSLEGKDSVLDGSSGSRENRIAKCAVAAMRAGFSMFAVQHGGQCYVSSTAPQTFVKYGKSTDILAECKGGTGAYQVYVIKATKPRTTTERYKILHRYYSRINALKVSDKDSLQNAANTTCHFIRENRRSTRHNINVLPATQKLELFTISYSKVHLKANESMDISGECLVMKIQRVPVNNNEAITFSVDEINYFEGKGRASISLPSAIFKGQDTVVVSILYNGIKPTPNEQHVKLNGKTFTNLELRSPIIASTVDPRPDDILQENVTISFHYGQELKGKNIAVCVFWNFTLKSKFYGSWSSKGCSLVKMVDKEIICTCNHLTNFAVLMQVGDNKVPSDHKMALEVITYVGCAMSLVGELLTVVAYCALMDLKEEQIQIRFNLVVAIAIAQVTFLAGIDASETRGVCVFVAALIHYFYLAGFAWMLFEGVYLYLMVVKVFNAEVRMRLFYAVAWGLPLLIVLLSIVIASSQDGGVHSYVRGDFCWVSFINNLIWTFVTPVLVVCLINTVILALVIHEILTMQTDKASELERIRQGVKACVVLFPLLGMTWVFGVLSVTDAGLAFQYIFTILNSLQGLFIFILHVLRNGDVRAAYSRKKQQWKQGNSIGASHAANHNSKDRNASLKSSVGLGSTVAM